jgi:hypothetical protein
MYQEHQSNNWMIKKLLLIGNSGLLPFYLNQDDLDVDSDLLSGFCSAIHSLSLELSFPLKNIDFQDHIMTVDMVKHPNDIDFLIASLFEDYHIAEGVKKKMKYIFARFFKPLKFESENERIKNTSIENQVTEILNDVPFKIYLTHKIEKIKQLLDPIIEKKENDIYAYALNSSCNTILYYNGKEDLYEQNGPLYLKDLIKKYLRVWRLEKIPQGDQFTGPELPMGLDFTDYCHTGRKTVGLVINTGINLKESPDNELLIYFFGKNMLMRSCVLNIEDKLRELFIEDKSN